MTIQTWGEQISTNEHSKIELDNSPWTQPYTKCFRQVNKVRDGKVILPREDAI